MSYLWRERARVSPHRPPPIMVIELGEAEIDLEVIIAGDKMILNLLDKAFCKIFLGDTTQMDTGRVVRRLVLVII
jgi:hypothetical protein